VIVKMWMAHDVVTVLPGTSITDAAALMAAKRVRRLPVVARREQSEHLVGIISSTDLYRVYPSNVNPFSAVAPDAAASHVTVDTVMNTSPLTTTAETPIEDVARVMCTRKIGALPVVHETTLVGLITESDIFRAFVSLFGSSSNSARVTFDLTKGEDIFGIVAGIATRRSVQVMSLNLSELDGRPVCVVRVTGRDVESFLDDLWKSKHPVLNVLRTI
jgi:acetoin utilization protein AcuB